MDFSKYTTHQLCVLIREATKELESRLPEPAYKVAVVVPDPGETPIIEAPTDAEQRHVDACIRLLTQGGVIRADDIKEYRRIYKNYPEYMKHKGFPDDVRGASARRYRDFHHK